MKKLTAVILTLAMILSMSGICFAEENSDPQERIAELEAQLKEKEERITELEQQVNALLNALVITTGASAGDPSAVLENETKTEPVPEAVSFHDKITYQDLEISFDEARIADHVIVIYNQREDTNAVGVFRPVRSSEGNVLLLLSGKIKNIGKQELKTGGNIFARFIIDGSETYTGKVTMLKSAGSTISTENTITPQMEYDFYITVELPAETAESFTCSDIILGFHRDGFDTNHIGATMKDAAVSYQFTVSKDDDTDSQIVVEKFEPEIYHLGDALATETIDLTLTELVSRKEMRESYNGTTYLNSGAADGSHNICLVGTFTNRAKRELLWTRFTGNVEIDGYTYKLESWVLDGMRLQPMMETKVFLYANVPDGVLENLEQGTFRFAFNEEMTNLNYEYEECDYSYVFTFGPEDIIQE